MLLKEQLSNSLTIINTKMQMRVICKYFLRVFQNWIWQYCLKKHSGIVFFFLSENAGNEMVQFRYSPSQFSLENHSFICVTSSYKILRVQMNRYLQCPDTSQKKVLTEGWCMVIKVVTPHREQLLPPWASLGMPSFKQFQKWTADIEHRSFKVRFWEMMNASGRKSPWYQFLKYQTP